MPPLAEAGAVHPNIPEGERSDLLVRMGPSITVVVGHLDPASGDPKMAVDKANETVPALVDTGAVESCIDDQLAKKLGLPVIDKQLCAGAGGTSTHDVYLAFITIPPLNFNQYGRFMGVHLAAGGQAHQVLLGRTLLSRMVMFYDGITGCVRMAT